MKTSGNSKGNPQVMRIQCEKCGAHYRVAEEKIADRTVRVRCQRCRTEMVIVGPPTRAPARLLRPEVRLGAQKRRKLKRRSFLRVVGRSLMTFLVLVLVGLGSYFMTTTPGIPKVYALAFIALNGVVWGAYAAR